MHVLFVEPGFPRNQREFVRALAAVGAHVTGIGESPLQSLDGQLKSWLHGYEQVPSVTHEPRPSGRVSSTSCSPVFITTRWISASDALGNR